MPIYIRPRSKGKGLRTAGYPQEPGQGLGTRHWTRGNLPRPWATEPWPPWSGAETPPWLVEPAHPEIRTIRDLVREFLGINKVAASTRDVLDTIVDQVGNVDLTEVAVALGRKLDPLAQAREATVAGNDPQAQRRAVAGFPLGRRTTDPCAWPRTRWDGCPMAIRDTPKPTLTALAAQGIDPPEDCERDRRIDPAEEGRIVAVLQQRLLSAQTLEQRAEAEGLQLMLELALQTAMRMREIYTLTLDQIQLERETIFLERSKNGDRRQVPPWNAQACAILKRHWPALEAIRQDGNRLLPWWDGRLTKDVLKRTTAEVSRRFADLFEEADSEDLHFHDTRHEAVCRWVLLTPITSEQLGRWGRYARRAHQNALPQSARVRGSKGAQPAPRRRCRIAKY